MPLVLISLTTVFLRSFREVQAPNSCWFIYLIYLKWGDSQMLINQNGMGTNQSEWSIGKRVGLRSPLQCKDANSPAVAGFWEAG